MRGDHTQIHLEYTYDIILNNHMNLIFYYLTN